MAVTFNGTTVTPQPSGTALPLELTSVSLGGGDVTMIDVTNAGHTRRKQVAGMPEPLSLTLEGHAADLRSASDCRAKVRYPFAGLNVFRQPRTVFA